MFIGEKSKKCMYKKTKAPVISVVRIKPWGMFILMFLCISTTILMLVLLCAFILNAILIDTNL